MGLIPRDLHLFFPSVPSFSLTGRLSHFSVENSLTRNGRNARTSFSGQRQVLFPSCFTTCGIFTSTVALGTLSLEGVRPLGSG